MRNARRVGQQHRHDNHYNELTNSRTKGRAGEQEVARILRSELNIDITRNWQMQAAGGKCRTDLLGVEGWAIEVKRAKKWSNDWWTQSANQASVINEKPVLIYKLDYRPWRVRCFARDIGCAHHHFLIEIDLLDWCEVVREEISWRGLGGANN